MDIRPASEAPQESRAHRIITLAAVVLPFLALIAAIILAWGWGVGWVELLLLAVMYVLTGTGITIGFHRLFTHRSFETIRPIEALLGVFGSMAVQGPLLHWVAVHRQHHQFSDDADDPHSPYGHGRGLRGFLRGLWHSHTGWLLTSQGPNIARYAPDLQADPMLRRISALFAVWVALGLLLPAAIGGLIGGSWTAFGLGFLWGGLVRVCLVHHLTWSINSVCHIWGGRPYEAHDKSRNNVVFGVLAFGEGWHNNHHAFPTSARHGLAWWQLDVSFLVIRALKLVGLAWRVRLPSAEALAAKRVTERRPANAAPTTLAESVAEVVAPILGAAKPS